MNTSRSRSGNIELAVLVLALPPLNTFIQVHIALEDVNREQRVGLRDDSKRRSEPSSIGLKASGVGA